MDKDNAKGTATAPIRVGMHTFGCRSNYADTVDLQASLLEEGAHPCGIDETADVYVINTCTVTDSADRDFFKLLRKLRRSQPDARVIVTGCMAEARQAELAAHEDIAAVVGPGRRAELVAGILAQREPPMQASPGAAVHPSGRRVKKSLPIWRSISLEHEMPSSLRGPAESHGSLQNRARFHLRVQEGCENSCTFCIIPSTRGRLSSRHLGLILKDIERLAERGYHEVVLTGTHLGGWGEDIGTSLEQLLAELGQHSAIPRIRLSSIDPNDLSDFSINCLVKYPVFCNHLHICFQAFSDRTLKRMNRKYRLAEAVSLVDRVAGALPSCAIGSDVIAGFPGERREEIEEGMDLFLRLPISYLHVFPYSERKDTAATRLDGVVPVRERKRRAARWRALAERKRDAFMNSLLGSRLEVICEQVDEASIKGTSREFASCRVSTSDSIERGSLLSVIAREYDAMKGELVCELSNPES